MLAWLSKILALKALGRIALTRHWRHVRLTLAHGNFFGVIGHVILIKERYNKGKESIHMNRRAVTGEIGFHLRFETEGKNNTNYNPSDINKISNNQEYSISGTIIYHSNIMLET